MNDIEQKERFKVHDLSSANWCFKEIAKKDEKLKEYEELALAEKKKIDDWLKKETTAIEHSRSHLEAHLIDYFYTKRKEDNNFKLSTPNGKITTRKQQPEVIRQDDIIINNLKNQNETEYIKVKEKLNWAKYKEKLTFTDGKAIDEHGEIIEGIIIIDREDKVNIKII